MFQDFQLVNIYCLNYFKRIIERVLLLCQTLMPSYSLPDRPLKG